MTFIRTNIGNHLTALLIFHNKTSSGCLNRLRTRDIEPRFVRAQRKLQWPKPGT
jgi:hypothetical protein